MKQLFGKKTMTTLVPDTPLPSLAACLLMDFLGYATFAVPFFGEFLDLLWAPVSAFIFMRMFGSRAIVGGVFNFVEELMPGLDFIPTFTLTWLFRYFRRPKATYTLQPLNR